MPQISRFLGADIFFSHIYRSIKKEVMVVDIITKRRFETGPGGGYTREVGWWVYKAGGGYIREVGQGNHHISL